MTAAPPQHHVTITLEASESLTTRIRLLTEAMVNVLNGARLLRVLSADYNDGGSIELVLEGSPDCESVSTNVHVETKPISDFS